jgi:hypothetical protein
MAKTKGWTKADERAFKRLLKQRRAAAERELNKINPKPSLIDDFADTLLQDYEATDAWENFMGWEHPDYVKEVAEELKNFEGGL